MRGMEDRSSRRYSVRLVEVWGRIVLLIYLRIDGVPGRKSESFAFQSRLWLTWSQT